MLVHTGGRGFNTRGHFLTSLCQKIYIMSKKYIDEFEINFSGSEDFSTDVLPNCTGKVYTYETKNFFIDIGSPESLDLANRIK